MIEYVGQPQYDRSRWMGRAYWLVNPWGTMDLSWITISRKYDWRSNFSNMGVRLLTNNE